MFAMGFLEVQEVFARSMAELSGVSYYDSLLVNCDLQGTLGLPWSVEPTHPVWQQFIGDLSENGTGIERAYRLYTDRYELGLIPDLSRKQRFWGCFAYDYEADAKAIHFHFANNDTSGYGPLSHHRQDVRLAELRSMFLDIRQEHPEADGPISNFYEFLGIS
jgi:hypothetical protein